MIVSRAKSLTAISGVLSIILSGLLIAPAGAKTDGITFEEEPDGYQKNWALIIGIDYKGREDDLHKGSVLQVLNNAANDAKALREVLTHYYNYDQNNVVLLTDDGEEKPDLARIRQEITRLHKVVKEEDSLLVFFAGHGYKGPANGSSAGSQVMLLPYDVEFHEGRPVPTTTIGIPDEFFSLINNVPSKHKLVILDCCYSGEIFSARGDIGFQPPTKVDRSDDTLQDVETFQAIASCRALQKAADQAPGGRNGNSRFTTALLDGLKHLPARREGDRRVWANRLLAYMAPHFDESQRPDCRSLIHSYGEFCFFPKPADAFEQFILDPSDLSQLRAMVVSRQGTWWFEEMPWFIPAIRKQVILDYEQIQSSDRSVNFVDLIDVNDLRSAASKAIERHENSIAKGEKSVTEIERMRFAHAKQLMYADPAHFHETLQSIERELEIALGRDTERAAADDGANDTPKSGPRADGDSEILPQDLHFLAVIQHALGMSEEAEETYRDALAEYEASIEDPEAVPPALRILRALCIADSGVFMMSSLREPARAADQFALARLRVSPQMRLEERGIKDNQQETVAAFFSIFMLCQEADACLSINHWTRANDLLEKARNRANAYAPGHFLQAHVYRRSAWAEIIQWHLQQAICYFEQSNQILREQFVRESLSRGASTSLSLAGDSANALGSRAVHGTAKPVVDSWATDASSVRACPLTQARTSLGVEFHRSNDHASKIAYLHNLHGIAMAIRFRGDTQLAATYYRWLAREVENSLSLFWDSSADEDLEQQFVVRFVNTQERLGDCNLFGIPSQRSPAEAIDDYRRAMSRVHLLREKSRERQMAALLYKQALALSIPSPVQNTKLALELCREADEVYLAERDKAVGNWQALGELTTPIVELLDAGLPTKKGSVGDSAEAEALRTRITSYRDQIGRVPHRDQLELCLFASKVLLEHANPAEQSQAMADSELLLSFCRLGLSPFHHHHQPGLSMDPIAQPESRAYLRPYYDAVMSAKVKHHNTHVKELLELQSEATQGFAYMKPDDATPCLAIYALDDKCYLLLDLPNGDGACVALGEMYDKATICDSCFTEPQLPLPREVQRTLDSWLASAPKSSVAFDLRWIDPIRDFKQSKLLLQDETDNVQDQESTAKPIRARFPFSLPSELAPPESTPTDTLTSNAD